MVLEIAYAGLSKVLPSKYWLRLVFTVIGIVILRTVSQGRKTTRERNLHARIILVTVAWPVLSTSFSNLPWDPAKPGRFHAARFNPSPELSSTGGAYNRTVSGTDLFTTH